MGVFKDTTGKTYIAILKATVGDKKKALRIANEHFKRAVKDLEIFSGNIAKDELKLRVNGNAWVITRKAN